MIVEGKLGNIQKDHPEKDGLRCLHGQVRQARTKRDPAQDRVPHHPHDEKLAPRFNGHESVQSRMSSPVVVGRDPGDVRVLVHPVRPVVGEVLVDRGTCQIRIRLHREDSARPSPRAPTVPAGQKVRRKRPAVRAVAVRKLPVAEDTQQVVLLGSGRIERLVPAVHVRLAGGFGGALKLNVQGRDGLDHCRQIEHPKPGTARRTIMWISPAIVSPGLPVFSILWATPRAPGPPRSFDSGFHVALPKMSTIPKSDADRPPPMSSNRP